MPRLHLCALLLLVPACSSPAVAPEGDLVGGPLTATERVALADLDARADALAGRPVLVEATARDVCAKKGCWMQLEDGGEHALVYWEEGCGGSRTFPAGSIGRRVLVQGTVHRAAISDEDAAHLVEEATRGAVARSNALEIRASAMLSLRRAD